jgi:uncharacterized protein YbcC (UPF0753/DUF2309 family)
MQSSLPLRDLIIQAIEHLDHVLPGQAPLQDFVHHNTLHGFQHLPFEDALEKFQALSGIFGYLPEEQYRAFYGQGRINDHDIAQALTRSPTLRADVTLPGFAELTRQDVYKLALLYDFSALTAHQLQWQLEEMQALTRVQADVPEAIKTRLLAKQAEAHAVNALWQTLLNKLDLEQAALHPETLLDLAQEHAEDWLAQIDTEACRVGRPFCPPFRSSDINGGQLNVAHPTGSDLETDIQALFAQVGETLSLRGLILALTGVDVLEQVRPQLIRVCASLMDEGVAPWTMPERQRGLYTAWKNSVVFDATVFFQELPEGHALLTALPDDAIESIILQLSHLELPQAHWAGYLERLALELPSWSGLINWRQQHPLYAANTQAPLALADYLAIRLTLDRLYLNQVCQATWKTDAKLGALQKYFKQHPAEFTVRQHVYQGQLPEYLTQHAEQLISQAQAEWHSQQHWAQLADLIHVWQGSAAADMTVYQTGWRLFRLMQHLGLGATTVSVLAKPDLVQLVALLDDFNTTERAKVWLVAYENHYRDAFFQALNQNHNRGRWATRHSRPQAQLIFCMDDREEGFRRHLEEYNPAVETLGAAGFFGVPMHYQALDETYTTPLCPIVVTPINTVHEQAHTGREGDLARHQRGRTVLFALANTLHQHVRRSLLTAQPLIALLAPLTLINVLAKTLFPHAQAQLLTGLAQQLSPPVETELCFNAPDPHTEATLAAPKMGFTDTEQANRVAGFLRNTGLTYGFAPLVVLLGHGSISQNNPHLAAYDCGACSGRHGGPNARLFAAMANRPIIRQLLAERGILIPADTWFIGTEHNTCDEDIRWYDQQDIPATHRPALHKLQAELRHAQQLSAHERCRRLASAPRNPNPKQALRHIAARASDFSQARPELGHATNAAAVIGRRSLTQGAFFDRRVFLISYDPTQDPDGNIVEGILLAVGPVGAGINLEYYFSTVNNERFGCGSKVPHNVTGFFAVMEGTSSDLRTGLPQQMVEIHEAMRLHILVEAKTAVLERIYAEQDELRELIAGGWVHLSSKDPDSGEIKVFERGVGFVSWQAIGDDLPIKANSPACYQGQTLPVAPVLIAQPTIAH